MTQKHRKIMKAFLIHRPREIYQMSIPSEIILIIVQRVCDFLSFHAYRIN